MFNIVSIVAILSTLKQDALRVVEEPRLELDKHKIGKTNLTYSNDMPHSMKIDVCLLATSCIIVTSFVAMGLSLLNMALSDLY